MPPNNAQSACGTKFSILLMSKGQTNTQEYIVDILHQFNGNNIEVVA
jgi:hypothetical protein